MCAVLDTIQPSIPSHGPRLMLAANRALGASGRCEIDMRASHALCFVLAGCLGMTGWTDVTGSWERDKTCVYATIDDIEAALERVTRALQARDPEALAATYSPDAILMGIDETSIRLGRSEIALHFTRLLTDNLTIATLSRSIEVGCSTAVVTGLQRVGIGRAPTQTDAVAEYKMMFDYGQGLWLMVHHHVALQPGERLRAPAPEVVARSPRTTGTLPDRGTPLNADPPMPTPATAATPTPAPERIFSMPQVLEMTVPPLQVKIGAFPLQQAAVLEPVVSPAPPALLVLPDARVPVSAIAVPALGLDIGAFPSPAPSAPITTAPAKAPSADSVAPAAKPAKAPAVASFSQRMVLPTPPVIAQPKKTAPPLVAQKPPVTAKVTALPASPTLQPLYKPGRWVDDHPVFDNK